MKLLLAGALALGLMSATSAQAATVNFDEFTSPPVTCCFGSTGVVGPRVYPGVTVVDGDGSGFVMNGDGWNDNQTSGDNLFGTLSGEISFLFSTPASNVSFDLINGTDDFTFTVTAFDGLGGTLGVLNPSLGGFGGTENVGHLIFGFGGIASIRIDGNADFAVDTLVYDGAVPEPASWAMMMTGFGLLGATMRRRSMKIAFA